MITVSAIARKDTEQWITVLQRTVDTFTVCQTTRTEAIKILTGRVISPEYAGLTGTVIFSQIVAGNAISSATGAQTVHNIAACSVTRETPFGLDAVVERNLAAGPISLTAGTIAAELFTDRKVTLKATTECFTYNRGS
ncbi:MAG: hypothetical protein GY906_40695 [bacterium]|nr:hypothetical protein [bacterium]